MEKGTSRMKVQKMKLAKYFILHCLCLGVLVFIPMSVVANEDTRGNLQIKTDRIMKGQNENTNLRETELEKVFPTLFMEETKEEIAEIELERERKMKGLEQSIFFIDKETATTTQDVRDSLFSEEYTAVAASKDRVTEESSSSSSLSNTLMAVFIGIGILLFVGLYAAMRSLFD